ncbi:hypothetical protein GCM10010313_29110 [Streptomyces violarus]|uniref:NADPH:quinone reductase-like Zn-dependent oxidoreductase n=1 Tax=Streptomyces violarus TaxID=67380 RepID=A0A7W4ZV69_9ACTN|nr:NADPH:quinone reductase-like Zn-dependent oxidoreductase [Streptomyces violarus]GHD08620.1 hypothetical protein GCM10010313_29110 [Streptomyces violarus]
MRAMRFGRFGGPEVLEEADAPDPSAGPGETLVRVEAAGIIGPAGRGGVTC